MDAGHESFTGIADLYERYRPGYPAAAVAAALAGLPAPARVADVGCGTGLAGRVFAAAGATVIGIEPNDDMRERARAAAAGLAVEFRAGTGEETGLPDAAVDLVVCAQSYQWLRPQRALPELHRIIRPGGRLALIWNDKSDTDPFTVAFSRILKDAQADAKRRGEWQTRNRSRDPGVSGLFVNVRRQTFPNPLVLDLEGALGRARSASFFPKSGPRRGELEGRIRDLFEAHARDGRVTLEHDTELTLADRAA